MTFVKAGSTMSARFSWAAPAHPARRRGILSDPYGMRGCSALSTPLLRPEMEGSELNVDSRFC